MVRHLYRAIRLLVPASQRRAVFQQVHELSHAGQWATRWLVAARFVWPGLAIDVVAWCKECAAFNHCQGDQAAQHYCGLDRDPYSQVQPRARGHCGAAPTVR